MLIFFILYLSHDIAKDTPPLLGLFHTFEGGVSLASEIFLRDPPSENLKIHPKIGACGGIPLNSSYRYRVKIVESKKIDI